MEKYSCQSKNKEVSIDKVLEELNVTENDILTKSYEEKSGLFGKNIDINKSLDKSAYIFLLFSI